MKALLVITKNLLDPSQRELIKVDGPDGLFIADVLPTHIQGVPGLLVWRNGRLLDNPLEQEVLDGDMISVLLYPGGIEVAIFGYAFTITWQAAAFAVALAGTYIAMQNMGAVQPPIEDQGSSNNSFAGFVNSYGSGDVVPVVYGLHRVAGPCINQQIETAQGSNVLGDTEAIHLMFALSEGPIAGIGSLIGSCASVEDAIALLGGASAISSAQVEKIGLQINGQTARNFTGVTSRWRTGENSQTPIESWEDSAETLVSGNRLLFTPGATLASIASGVYSIGNEISGIDGDFYSLTMAEPKDRARVHLSFPRGLFEQSGGSITSRSIDMRIQYWPVDAGGIRTGDTIVLPPFLISGSQSTQVVYDIPLTFYSSSDYTAPQQLGYYAANAGAGDWIQVFSASGAPQVPGGSGVTNTDIAPFVLPDNYLSPVVGGSADPGAGDMRFGFESWCRPNNLPQNPNAVVMFYGEDEGVVNNTYPFLATNPLAGRNGCELAIKVDGAAQSSTAWLVYASWNGSTMNWWRANIGTVATINDAWVHIGVAVHVPDNNTAVQTVQLFFNGQQVTATPGPTSANAAAGNTYFESAPVGGTAIFFAGRRQGATSGAQGGVRVHIATWGLYDGVNSSAAAHFFGFSQLVFDRYSSINFDYGWKDGSIPTEAPFLRLGFNAIAAESGGSHLRNVAFPDYPEVDGVAFRMNDPTALQAAPQSTVPIYSVEQGTPVKDRYQLEVFRATPDLVDPLDGSSEVVVEDVTLLLDQTYEYPLTALFSTRIVADDQVQNSRPVVSLLVRGRLCPVWDGLSPTFPTFNEEWTQNPAWIALDALTNERYGLGGIFKRSRSIDLPAFKEWADYCDEGVEDGYGTQEFYGASFAGSSSDAIYGSVTMKIGIIDEDDDPTGNVIPRAWAVGKTLGIKTATSPSGPNEAQAYVTTTSDTRLEILSIRYISDGAAADGFKFRAEVRCKWVPNLLAPIVTGDVTGTVVGFEARHQFDGVFDQKSLRSWDAIVAIFQAGRAMPVPSGNRISVFVDKRRDVSGIITMANIIEGSFRLAWTGSKSAPNSLDVDIIDADLNYETNTFTVNHESLSDPSKFDSFRKEPMRMRGVVRKSQAVRDANFRLAQYQELSQIAYFDLGTDGIPVSIGQRVHISHDSPEFGVSGRLLQGTTSLGNFASSAESMLGGLVGLGGVYDASVAHMEVAGYPTSSSANSDYQTTGPLGYGSADAIRFRALGTGADAGGLARTAGSWAYFEANDSALYPPTANPAVLDIITDDAWVMTVSAYVKEPAIGAGERIQFGLRVPVSANGTVVDEKMTAEFRWNAGVLQNAATYQGGVDGGSTSVTSIGSGWYRIAVTWGYADKVGGSAIEVGDPVQLIFAPAAPYSVGGGGVVPEFFPVSASGTGKGVNFLAYGDPLDLSKTSVWTANGTVSYTVETGAGELPPFYYDQAHGAVHRIQAGASNGETDYYEAAVTIESAAVNFGSGGVAATDNFMTTLYIQRDDASSTRVRVEGPSGDFVMTDIAWPAATLTTSSSGGGTAAIAAVKLNSTTNDANWYQLDLQFLNSNQDDEYVIQVWPDHTAAAATNRGVYIWGVRTHGEDSLGGVTANSWAHRGQYVWGLEAHRRDAVATYEPGATVILDRDFTFEMGKEYELEVRSQTAQSDNGKASVESVPISAAMLGTTIVAGNLIATAASFLRFTPRHGDVYAIGELGNSVFDASITSITLDPETLTRQVMATQYKDSVYDAFSVDQVAGTLAFLAANDPSPETALSTGLGALGGSGVQVVESTRRSATGGLVAGLKVTWGYARGNRNIGGVRLYVAKVNATTGVAGKLEQVADVPRRQTQYEITGYPFVPETIYRVFVQAYGQKGLSLPAQSCPSAEVKFWGSLPPSAAPTLGGVTTTGDRTLIRINKAAGVPESEKPTNYEMRVGGWLLGQRVSGNILGGVADLSMERYTGPSNSYGDEAPTMVTRGLVPGGQYTAALRSTNDLEAWGYDATPIYSRAFEDDWTTGTSFPAGVLTEDTSVTPSVIRFDGGSSALEGGFNFNAGADITHPRRVYVEAWVEADYEHSQTLGDFGTDTIGGRRANHWTIEGPITGPEFDASVGVKVEWTPQVYGVEQGSTTELRPGIHYFDSSKFSFTVTRASSSHDVKIKRFGIVIYELEPFRYDGGTIA